jgi:hypothetical protein
MSKEKEMQGFVWLHEWSDNADNFDDAQLAAFCRAMFAAARGKKYTLPEDPLALLAFKYANRDRERMDAFKKKQSKNGGGGGAPLGNKNASKQPKNNPKTTEEQPKNNPKQAQGQGQGQGQGQPQEQSQGQNQIQNNQDDDDNARGMSSVVVGLLDFLRNIYGDFNFTPSQVALINSKPAEYWDYFMNEIEASKWLKSKDPALALRLHEKVVNGEYRTYEKHEQPTPPPVPAYTPSPEQRQLDELLDEWRTITGRTDEDRLEEMERRHPQLPDSFRKAIGMCWFRNMWYWKG